MVMKMAASHECLHEEQIQGQSREIEKLTERSKFKEYRLDELNVKIDKLTDKMDGLVDSVNELKIDSNDDNNALELRLKTIETKIDAQEQTIKENKEEARARTNKMISYVGLFFTALTIGLSIYFNLR